MGVLRRWVQRCYSLEVELALVAATILVWHAVRIPLEGGVGVSIAHARDVLDLERALGVDVELWLIRLASESGGDAALRWLYSNIHLPVLFGFLAAARLLAPLRYPLLRTTFVLSFVPAALVIGLYPLAPPRWLPELEVGQVPSQSALAGTAETLFHNETAAAASQHFGFAIFLAAASVWLFPRSRLAWATFAYPALLFVVIVGTGNHYVVDCVIGTLTFVLAAGVASLVHRGSVAERTTTVLPGAMGIAFGWGLIVWGFVSLDLMSPLSWHNLFPEALVLAGGVTAVLAPRLGPREPVTESG